MAALEGTIDAPRAGAWIYLWIAVVITALVGPASNLWAQAPADIEKELSEPIAIRKTGAGSDLEPFDLSYLPVKSGYFVAFRPAEILRRGDMKRHSGSVRAFIDELLTPAVGLSVGVDSEAIEQVAIGLMWSPTSGKKDRPDGPNFGSTVIRSAVDLDLEDRLVRSMRDHPESPLSWVKVAFEGRGYYRYGSPDSPPTAHREPNLCLYFPDVRTVVIADEEILRGLIRQPIDSRPDPAKAEGWRRISRGLAAAASEQAHPEDSFDPVSGLVVDSLLEIVPRRDTVWRLFCGIDSDERLSFCMTSQNLRDANDAAHAVRESQEPLQNLRDMASELDRGASSKRSEKTEPLVSRLMKELADNCRIHRDGRMIGISTGCRAGLTELADLMGGPPLKEPPVPKLTTGSN